MKRRRIIIIAIICVLAFIFFSRDNRKDFAAKYAMNGGSTTGFGVVSGGSGNDTINGHGVLSGGDGDDTISGNGTISGGNGNDTLTGNGVLDGGAGDDIINVHNGLVIGGRGDDKITVLYGKFSIGEDCEISYKKGDGDDTVITNGQKVTLKMKNISKKNVEIIKTMNSETGYEELSVNMKDGSGSITFVSSREHKSIKSFLPDKVEFADDTLKFN